LDWIGLRFPPNEQSKHSSLIKKDLSLPKQTHDFGCWGRTETDFDAITYLQGYGYIGNLGHPFFLPFFFYNKSFAQRAALPMATTTPATAPTNAMVQETRLSSDEKTEVGSNNIMDTTADNKDPQGGSASRSGSVNGNPAEQEPQYPGAAKLTLIISSLCLAIFLVALDQTIIAPALGAITAQFRSVKDIGWYGSSYLLTTTALQPMYGTIYKYFNVKIAYLGAVFIFEIGSLISAVAPSSVAFIVGRAIAGVCRPSPPI
jgi:hypothetical protein